MHQFNTDPAAEGKVDTTALDAIFQQIAEHHRTLAGFIAFAFNADGTLGTGVIGSAQLHRETGLHGDVDGLPFQTLGDLDGGVFNITAQPDPDVDCGAFTDTVPNNVFTSYFGGPF